MSDAIQRLVTIQQSASVARLAVRLRAFRSALAPDEAALLDDWLDRAARPS